MVWSVGLRDRINKQMGLPAVNERATIDTWLQDFLLPANNFTYGGTGYQFGGGEIGAYGLTQTYQLMKKTKEINASLPNYMDAIGRCPPAFAAQIVRAQVISQARFTFRRRPSSKRRGMWSSSELSLLEQPWPNANTGDLISRMEWHEGLSGNAYVIRQSTPQGPRLRVLRPDWVALVYASEKDPEDPTLAIDAELIGYLYCNGGFRKVNARIDTILPEDIAHWYPLPDPTQANMGMSWLTPAMREIQADQAANDHKLTFFSNGATPNLVIKGLPAIDKDSFDKAVDKLESRHRGTGNAYKTLYLSAGADATVVGSSFSQMNFEELIGAGETRISALSRVPAIILGLSEGLKGAALNAGNFGQVRRMFGDTWIYPMLQNLANSLSPLINVPSDSELWFNTTDMPILREDQTDQASITQTRASTIGQLVRDGFTPESATQSVLLDDLSLLIPIEGWISVQLQNMIQPAKGVQNGAGNDNNSNASTSKNGNSDSGQDNESGDDAGNSDDEGAS